MLIVDEHKLFAEAIEVTLERQGMTVLGVVTNGGEALDVVREDKPDVILIDLGLPDEDGIDVGKLILEEHPDTKVVVLTGLEDSGTIKEAIRAGFHGYVTKDTRVSQFVGAIRTVAEGSDQVVIPQPLARRAVEVHSENGQGEARLANQLTRRELAVLALLASGCTGQNIAERLHISPNTVRTHVQNILSKLCVHSRLEAAAFGIRHGIVRASAPRSLAQPPTT